MWDFGFGWVGWYFVVIILRFCGVVASGFMFSGVLGSVGCMICLLDLATDMIFGLG